MLNIAHRGASGRFPENTLDAFAAAIEAGAAMCELDVRTSSDGAVVVIHDETIDRTTDGSGAVNAMTLRELRQFSASAKFGVRHDRQLIPTLDEVFDLVKGRCGLNVELKAEGVEHRVSDIVHAHQAVATTVISSFDWDALARVRYMAPDIRVGLLASEWPARLLGAATEMRADSINPEFKIVTEDLCIAAHDRGINVYTWTVDDIATMRRLIAYGVDGIMTNFPERLAALMDA